MGVLLAYMFFGRGSAKQSAGGAAIIHFLGGIHEIYFPYVLMNPRLIPRSHPRRYDWRVHADYPGRWSGFSGISGFYPGRAGDDAEGCLLREHRGCVCRQWLVSFVVSAILLKTSKVKEDDDIDAATRRMHDMKAESKGASPLAAGDVTNDLSHVRKIIVACDAGMGSSAMGAGVLRKKVQDAGLSSDFRHQQRD